MNSPLSWRRASLSYRFLTLAAVLALTPAQAVFTQSGRPSEYQLKAAFLFNFTKFIDWPAAGFSSPQAPFSVCILGADSFGRVLDDALAGKTFAGRSIVVRRCPSPADARDCQILFVSRPEAHNLAEILQALRGANVLIVGESEGFAAGGGAVEFFLQDDRVRFRINPEAAAREGVTISSKLLALAVIVHEGSNNGKS